MGHFVGIPLSCFADFLLFVLFLLIMMDMTFTLRLIRTNLAYRATAKNRVTRGIWKVLSMGLYLSNRFTNPIMFGINLKSYLSSMLWHKFHEAIKMQTRKIVL